MYEITQNFEGVEFDEIAHRADEIADVVRKHREKKRAEAAARRTSPDAMNELRRRMQANEEFNAAFQRQVMANLPDGLSAESDC